MATRTAVGVGTAAAIAALVTVAWFTLDVTYAPVPRQPAAAVALAPSGGAGDAEQLALGEQVFYADTSGNEAIFGGAGLLDGPLPVRAVAAAVLALEGGSTTSLRVALAEDVTIAGRTLRAGELIDTGLDVPAGGLAPLGISIGLRHGSVQVGITCALCHATVDRRTGRVVPGAPNADLALGTLLALAPRTATLAGGAAGQAHPEEAVDRALVAWPPGRVDGTADGVLDPTDIPALFSPRAFVPGGFHASPAEERLAALAAWRATLSPPPASAAGALAAEEPVDDDLAAEGHAVFVRGGCAGCHAGPSLSDDGMMSGVRTPPLIGLAWSAPYLRDGGAAVGADALRDVGVLATALRGVPADPTESLRAVVDRAQRDAVLAANRVAGVSAVRVTGAGHPFWVDERSGFDRAEQDALLAFLLGYHVDPADLGRARKPEVAAAD